jgi:hypothetical protein
MTEMSADLAHLTRHAYHGYLTVENVEAVADRLRKTLGDGPFIAVQASPYANDGIPTVHTGCRLSAAIEARTFESGGQALCFGDGHWSYVFDASARNQAHAAEIDEQDRTRIAFNGYVFTVTSWSPARLQYHYVFAPEVGGE